MNRLTFNLIYWPCCILSIILLRESGTELFVGGLAIASLVVAGFRIKALNRSLWNIIWLFIPIVALFYSIWLGTTTDKR